MLQKREQAPKCGSNEEGKKYTLIILISNMGYVRRFRGKARRRDEKNKFLIKI
jgi:hypothetical protein